MLAGGIHQDPSGSVAESPAMTPDARQGFVGWVKEFGWIRDAPESLEIYLPVFLRVLFLPRWPHP